ncbi:MAG: hypothetical protein WC869_09230 [Phycisphaerae bacterium]|jgi:hypothetical protein
MLGVILIIAGILLMLLGMLMITGWVNGKSSWFDSGVYDRQGSTKTDRQFLDLYFIVLVIAPLLVGAMLIVFGLQMFR